MRPRPHLSERQVRDQSGFVLVVVLIVIAMLSLSGYAFTELMSTEYKAAHVQGSATQARLAAESGVELVKAYLAMAPQARQEFGGHFDNPERFQGVQVSGLEAGDLPGRFSIIAPSRVEEDPPKLRFGLGAESAKLNLHAILEWDREQPGAGRAALLNLPGMTEEIADSILDWMDADDEPREFGAEAEYYSRIEPRYLPPNAVPQALEELLWVRGVTARLLFGSDRNQNGAVDAHEVAWGQAPTADSRVDAGPLGWSAWLTLHSAEGSRSSEGQPKINLNHANLSELYDQLLRAFDEEWATFIIAYRQFGPYIGPEGSASGRPLPPDLALPAKFELASILDLIAVRVQVSHPELASFVLPCPFENNGSAMREYLPRLMDRATTDPPRVVGRIDINEAPREVLLAIPAMSAGLVEDIVGKRSGEAGFVEEERRQVTWPLLEGLVDLEQMKGLMRYLCTGGDVFRAQTVGYREDGVIFRAEIVVDATFGPPRLVSWRDLQRLGRGYDIALLGLTPRGDTPQTPPTPVSSTP